MVGVPVVHETFEVFNSFVFPELLKKLNDIFLRLWLYSDEKDAKSLEKVHTAFTTIVLGNQLGEDKLIFVPFY